MKLTKTQIKKMDEIHNQFKLDLKEADLEDEFEICQRTEREDNWEGKQINEITLHKSGIIAVRSSTTELKEIKSVIMSLNKLLSNNCPPYIN